MTVLISTFTMIWLTWFHFLTVCFIIVQSNVCVCYKNASAAALVDNATSSIKERNAERPVAAALTFVDDIAIAACQTVWLNKLHRATYGSPTDIPFLLPPQLPTTNVSLFKTLGHFFLSTVIFQVTLDIAVNSVTQLSQSIIAIQISITPSWIDSRFGWDSRLDCPLTSVHLRSNRIWRPALGLTDQMSTLSIHQINLPLITTYSGQISFAAPVVTEITCFLSVRLFPYDRQHCRLTIASEVGNAIAQTPSTVWNFDSYENFNFNNYFNSLGNKNWHIDGVYGKPDPSNDGILTIYFRLTRQNSFSFTLWIITSVFLMLLVCSSLALEPSSVEKMVTSFIAVIGYLGQLMLILYTLPIDLTTQTDASVPLILDFTLVQFVLGVTAVGLNGVVVQKWFSDIKEDILEEKRRGMAGCCNAFTTSALDNAVKVTCRPATTCIEESFQVSHCKAARNNYNGQRICPSESEVSTDPITSVEKGNNQQNLCPGHLSVISPLGPKLKKATTKCKKPRHWMKQTLLIGYFLTMLFVYASFIIVMVINVAEAKALSPVAYSTPY